MEDISILLSREDQFDNLNKFIRGSPEAKLKKPKKLITRLPEARFKGHRPCIHSDPYQQPHSWTIAVKLLTKSFQVGTQFWEHEPTASPFAWQRNKTTLSFSITVSVFVSHWCTGSQDFDKRRVGHSSIPLAIEEDDPVCMWSVLQQTPKWVSLSNISGFPFL